MAKFEIELQGTEIEIEGTPQEILAIVKGLQDNGEAEMREALIAEMDAVIGEQRAEINLLKAENDELRNPKPQLNGYVDMLAYIKDGAGECNALHGFEDGQLVEIVEVRAENKRHPYEVRNLDNTLHGYANEDELELLF